MRVVSLLPSATEIVYALGLEDQLVGVTFECNEPAQARTDKAVVVGGLDTVGLTPGDIDALVRAKIAAGENLYTLDAAAMSRLAPDVILTQDLCRVCALPSTEVEDALDFIGCTADVVSLDPHTLEEVIDSVATIGRHTDSVVRAEAYVASLRERLESVRTAVARRTPPKVAVIEWVDPPFTAGHWVPDLVSAAGGIAVAAQPGARSVQMTWDDVRAAQPDVVIVAPCGFHLDHAVTQAGPVVSELPGVPVWAIDADAFVVRPGPRLVDGVEAIASILHPDAVPAPPPGRIARVS